MARAVIRRAERRVVSHLRSSGIDDSRVVVYLNRLADFVFMLARAEEGNSRFGTSSKGDRVPLMTSVEAAQSHHRRPRGCPDRCPRRTSPPAGHRAVVLAARQKPRLSRRCGLQGRPRAGRETPATDDIDMESVLLVGLGPTADNEALRRAAGWAARSAGGRAVVTDLHTAGTEGAVRAVTEGFLLGGYRFDRYRSRPKPPPPSRLVLSGPMAPRSTSRKPERRRRGRGSGARPGPRAGSRPISR